MFKDELGCGCTLRGNICPPTETSENKLQCHLSFCFLSFCLWTGKNSNSSICHFQGLVCLISLAFPFFTIPTHMAIINKGIKSPFLPIQVQSR